MFSFKCLMVFSNTVAHMYVKTHSAVYVEGPKSSSRTEHLQTKKKGSLILIYLKATRPQVAPHK